MTKLLPKGVFLRGERATASSFQRFFLFFFSTNCKLSHPGVINHKSRSSQGAAAASSHQLLSFSYSGNIRHHSSSYQLCGSLHRRRHLLSQNNLHDLNQYDNRHYTTTTTAQAAVPLTPGQRDTLLSKLIEPENNFNNNKIMNYSGGNLGKWKLLLPPSRDAITKTYYFIDFQQAWTFMTKVSILAEKMNHHPEWSNVYNRVEVTLTTHDCHGLSTNDIEMATMMDEYELELLSGRPK